jgi:hypothetical protein
MHAPHLNDRQKIELALPANFFFALSICDVFALDPAKAAEPDAAEKGAKEIEKLRELLRAACWEPIANDPEKKQRNLANRIYRIATEVSADLDQQLGTKVALTFYYWLEDLLSRGVLICYEGSAFGRAVSMLFDMMKHAFEVERLDASAQKQARKLLDRLQAQGYYR